MRDGLAEGGFDDNYQRAAQLTLALSKQWAGNSKQLLPGQTNVYLFSILILIPCLGRSVKPGAGCTEVSSTLTRRNLRAIIARINTASVMANDAPIHCLGPPPKGK